MRRISWFALRGVPKVGVNAFRQFGVADAVRFLMLYGGATPFEKRTFTLRSGQRVLISSPLDVATLAVIFLRGDYGRVDRGSVVVDVGANVGFFTLWAAGCGAKRIVALEPEPSNFSMLAKNCGDLMKSGVVEALPYGVAAESVERSLVIRESPTHSLYASNPAEGADTIRIPCLSLDAVLTENGLRVVDLLKMDIEGGEYEVLYGASEETFGRIREIRIEYHNLDDDERNHAALRRHLERNGFAVAREAPISTASGMLWFLQNRRTSPHRWSPMRTVR